VWRYWKVKAPRHAPPMRPSVLCLIPPHSSPSGLTTGSRGGIWCVAVLRGVCEVMHPPPPSPPAMPAAAQPVPPPRTCAATQLAVAVAVPAAAQPAVAIPRAAAPPTTLPPPTRPPPPPPSPPPTSRPSTSTPTTPMTPSSSPIVYLLLSTSLSAPHPSFDFVRIGSGSTGVLYGAIRVVSIRLNSLGRSSRFLCCALAHSVLGFKP
jgi:hypothetical protein